ncbi:MAG TPA: hypothetical protein V6C63_07965 [Allocoleopsis sp.]
MDAATQLALMAKAKKVFGNDQTFLSFPVTPLPYTKQQLDFQAEKNLENLQKFSTLVNQIPRGDAWLPTGAQYLWDVYDSILKEATFADSTRNAAEEVAYQNALRYLFIPHEDGTRSDSPVFTTYKRYKDAWIVAQEQYAAAKSTALYSTDAAEKQRWQDIEEPTLRAQISDRLSQWIVDGYKNEVEAAQAKFVSLGARSPVATIQEWRNLFIAEIDTVTSAVDLSSALSSSFSPSNALAEGAWQSFKLTEAEVNALVAEAPAELRSRLGVTNASIASLTFEFSSATVLRPWFNSDVFKTRFWRFPDGRVLCNGATPPSGVCPAYVTALVFARKLVITPKAKTTSPPSTKNDFKFSAIAQIDPKVFQEVPQPVPPPQKTILADQAQLKPNLSKQILIDQIRIKPSRMQPMQAPRSASYLPRDTARWSDIQIHETPPIISQEVLRHRFERLEEASFERLPTSPQETPTNQAPPVTQPQPQDDSIYVLAFICKQLPKCPDPDLGLQWV